MNTNFIDKYMAIKDEEKNALNSLLEKLPGKQYDLEENECMIGVDCWLNDEHHHADVKKVVYPITSDHGIFVEDDYTELTEIGTTDINYGEMSIIIDQLPDPDVAALNEQCKHILDKVSKGTEYKNEELYVNMYHGEDKQPLYSIVYDNGILEDAHDMSYEDVQHYLNGIEFAVDMWVAED